MSRALDGVLVLDLGQIYNGPYATMLLQHLGATVIKVEPAAGEPIRWRGDGITQSQAFSLLNGGKQGLGLDLKNEDGKAVFLRLVSKADLVVENFAPGVMERLGLGYADLAERNPRIILASGKGFAPDGPYRDLRAMDVTVQAMTGIVATTGFADGAPVKTGPAIADFLAGTHLAAAALAALYQRTVTGRGQHVEVAMQDAVLPSLTSNIAGYLDSDGALPERTGNRHGGLSVCPYNIYQASDGWVAILCIRERHWQTLCELIERPDLRADANLATAEGRVRSMTVVDEAIEEWTKRHTQAELFQQLQAKDIPCSPVRSLADVINDPDLQERGLLVPVDVEDAAGAREFVFGNPLRLSDSPPITASASPTIGQHNREVLSEVLGLTDTEIDALTSSGGTVTRAPKKTPPEVPHAVE